MQINPSQIYSELYNHFGPQHWWPIDKTYHKHQKSDPRFEIIIGTILTQNTAWSNVEKAINHLKNKNMLSIKQIEVVEIEVLKKLIKSSGFFNQKANRLKIISKFLIQTYDGNLDQMFLESHQTVRKKLLNLKGIGKETADSILLYAGCKPVFVVDAYTKRLCHKLSLPVNLESYEETQRYFQHDLINNYDKSTIISIYNELHSLIVEWGKNYCLKQNPNCISCPLISHCTSSQKMI